MHPPLLPLLMPLLILGFGVRMVCTDKGVLYLDNTTFDRVVGGTAAAFVRIDNEYSYGDESDEFLELAKWAADSNAKLLICSVAVEPASSREGLSADGDDDFGADDSFSINVNDDDDDNDAWRENQDVAERFGVGLNILPQFLLFPAGWLTPQKPQIYEGPREKEAFGEFLQRAAGVWLGLPGQVERMHSLAAEFRSASPERRAELLAIAQEEGHPKDAAAAYYIKVMSKAMVNDGFIEKERSRLRHIIDDGAVSGNKRVEFNRRLNALASFL